MLKKITALTLLCVLLPINPVYAEKRAGGGTEAAQAAAAMQNVLRQTTSERDALAEENKKLKADLENMKLQLAKVQNQADASKEALNKFQEANTGMVDRISAQNDKMQEVIAKFKETIATMRKMEMEKAGLAKQVEEQTQQLEQAKKDNLKMYEISQEVLAAYEKKGVWTALMQKEPFTQIKRVEIENTIEKYRAEMNKASAAPQISANP
ncbi:MAG TPA: hypothetical protein VFM46_08635 [Pseudomonadales bacterium]|nr:hypothetical protein [Pseudomonadales bacterium]